MTRDVTIFRILSGTFLIAGTMIGAGMLGIPLVTGASGFIPGALASIFVWFFMYCTGLLFLEITLWMPDGSNLLSIAHRFLGKSGKIISGLMFIFLYYCLMVAYFAAGAPLLNDLFQLNLDKTTSFALFGILFGTVVAISPKSIDRVNIIMSVGMILSWFMLIGNAANEVKLPLLVETRFSNMLLAMPVLFSAFGFHNVIPSLCTYLKRDKKALRQAILFGSLLPLIVYLVWQWLIIGMIPKQILLETEAQGYGVTEAFSTITQKPFFFTLGSLFAFFAIITSILGVSFSIVDFLGDGLKIQKREGLKRVFLTSCTFIPPFIFVILYPQVFTKALGIAGGIGEAFLNGLLPIGVLWIGKEVFQLKTHLRWLENKTVMSFLILCSLFVIILELFELIK